jgi:two-component system CheB/CheR fusion protein
MLVALHDGSGKLLGYGKIIRNRTDLREQLDALRNQVAMLEAAAERSNAFIGTLAHELRSPLTPLSSAVQLIRMRAGDVPELEQSIDLIERQVGLIGRLIDDLLDATRISTGKVRLNRRRCTLREIVADAIEATRQAVEERAHHLEAIVPSGTIELEADPDRLHQVLVNLITNAAKYTPEGGRIWVKATTEGDEAVLHVEDTGVGIPHDMLPRIFDLFTQVETPVARGGLGIGLSLVKELVALHGGTVQVRSEGTNKGTEFTVRLPLGTSRQ